MNLRRRQNENDILRRFLQRLKQCIKRSYREHMHLINNVNLVFPFSWTICNLLANLTNVIHTIIRCSINLNHIHGCTCTDSLAHLALATRTSLHRIQAVHCLCKYLCNCRLTGSSGSAEKIRMSDTIGLYLIL